MSLSAAYLSEGSNSGERPPTPPIELLLPATFQEDCVVDVCNSGIGYLTTYKQIIGSVCQLFRFVLVVLISPFSSPPTHHFIKLFVSHKLYVVK